MKSFHAEETWFYITESGFVARFWGNEIITMNKKWSGLRWWTHSSEFVRTLTFQIPEECLGVLEWEQQNARKWFVVYGTFNGVEKNCIGCRKYANVSEMDEKLLKSIRLMESHNTVVQKSVFQFCSVKTKEENFREHT